MLRSSFLYSIEVAGSRWVRARSLSSQTLFNRLLASDYASRQALKVSAPAAIRQIAKAQQRVPAYQKLLHAKSWKDQVELTKTERLKSLPETDKHGYIDTYSTAERCLDGTIPKQRAEIDESSGSSGKPYNWIRGRDELVEMRRTLSRLATFMYGPDLVTINGFSMGAWATGTNVSMALVQNGLIKSTGPDPEKMISAMELLGKNRTYIITGYPPFLLELLEYGKKIHFPWEDYTMIGIVGGEAMSETLRSRLLEYFKTITSAYGASDLDIGVACEFPVSTWIRQQAHANPELATALFGDSRRLPMLFQYDPLDYYVEQNDQQELIVTVNRPSALSPRLRYNVHDVGGTRDFADVIRICQSFGLDPLKDAPLPYAGTHPKLPFLFIGGRSDSTISYLGANIYPEDVEQAIFADAPVTEKDKIKGFAIELLELEDGQVRPCVHVELCEAMPQNTVDPKEIGARIRERLMRNSRDFKTSISEDPRAGDFKIIIHLHNTGPFEGMKDRIKRRYIIKGKDLH
jgi:phenylacetate-CoA ligase